MLCVSYWLSENKIMEFICANEMKQSLVFSNQPIRLLITFSSMKLVYCLDFVHCLASHFF